MHDSLTTEGNKHEQILALMREVSAEMMIGNAQLRIPARSLETMGTQFLDIVLGKSLTAKVPFHEEFSNPTGVMQGGFLCAAFDEVFGPLSYMTARSPAVAIEMNTSLLRPFQAEDKSLTVHAEVLSHSRSLLLLEARGTRPDGKLIAVAKVNCLVLSNAQLSKFAESDATAL